MMAEIIEAFQKIGIGVGVLIIFLLLVFILMAWLGYL